MYKLPTETRVQILNMLCEGSSMRAISRVADVIYNYASDRIPAEFVSVEDWFNRRDQLIAKRLNG